MNKKELNELNRLIELYTKWLKHYEEMIEVAKYNENIANYNYCLGAYEMVKTFLFHLKQLKIISK